jgi:hypothetical protein
MSLEGDLEALKFKFTEDKEGEEHWNNNLREPEVH